MSKIRGIIAFIQFGITIIFLIILMFIFRKHNHKIRKKWSLMQLKLLGIKLEIEGKIDEQSQMIILNHQSLLDIVIIEALYPKNLAWVGKKQITDILFFGNIMKLPNMITIDREDKTGIVTLIKEAKNRLEDNRPIAIFPEGTRSDGKSMKRFKSGTKLLANKYGLNVQPIVLIGTKNILDSQKISANQGSVKVIFLEAIKASKDTTWFEQSEEKMREIFYKEIENCN